MEDAAQANRRLAEQWDVLLKRVRDIPGFENFLQLKKFAQLCCAADAGPVIVINVHQHRCDALVLMSGLDEVIHIPLDRFSYKKALELQRHMNQLLFTGRVRTRDVRAMRRVQTTTCPSFPSILSDLWLCVVQPVLDCLALTVSCLTPKYLLV